MSYQPKTPDLAITYRKARAALALVDAVSPNTYHCRECGQEVESEGLETERVMACKDHPSAIVDSVSPKGDSE